MLEVTAKVAVYASSALTVIVIDFILDMVISLVRVGLCRGSTISNKRWRTIPLPSGARKGSLDATTALSWWNVTVTWLFVVVAVLVLAGVFLATLGLLGDLPPVDPDYRPSRVDDEPEFDVVVRGYRMDEVDLELARMQHEIDRLQGPALTVSPDEPDKLL